MPVYNAAASLQLALDAGLQQQYQRLEFILINDASRDNSLEIMQGYLPRMQQQGMSVKIIDLSENKGPATARNMGLDQASGTYIYFMDADDSMEPEAIALLVEAAESSSADIVGCNWFLSFEQQLRRMNQPAFSSPVEALTAMMHGIMRWNLWLFMIRRSLFLEHQVRFTPGMDMGEDLLLMIRLFIHAERVAFVDRHLYHYRQSNSQSLTKTYAEVHMRQVTANLRAVEQCLMQGRYAELGRRSLDFLKLNIKLPLLITDREEQYRRWLSWFPEANARIMDNKLLPLRTRLLQWFACKQQFWALKLYYRLVIRFVYGTIYK